MTWNFNITHEIKTVFQSMTPISIILHFMKAFVPSHHFVKNMADVNSLLQIKWWIKCSGLVCSLFTNLLNSTAMLKWSIIIKPADRTLATWNTLPRLLGSVNVREQSTFVMFLWSSQMFTHVAGTSIHTPAGIFNELLHILRTFLIFFLWMRFGVYICVHNVRKIKGRINIGLYKSCRI